MCESQRSYEQYRHTMAVTGNGRDALKTFTRAALCRHLSSHDEIYDANMSFLERKCPTIDGVQFQDSAHVQQLGADQLQNGDVPQACLPQEKPERAIR